MHFENYMIISDAEQVNIRWGWKGDKLYQFLKSQLMIWGSEVESFRKSREFATCEKYKHEYVNERMELIVCRTADIIG